MIDGYMCEETAVETVVSQGSPVLPVQFVIYLSEVFREVEQEVEGCMPTSFADDCAW